MVRKAFLFVSVLALCAATAPVAALAQDAQLSDAGLPQYQGPAQSGPQSIPEIANLLNGNLDLKSDSPALPGPGEGSIQPVDGSGQPTGQRTESGGHSDYCDRSLGTWFYCADPQPDPQQQANKAGGASSQSQDEKDLAAAKLFRDNMEKARQIAVWNPTEQNLRRYYAYQQATMDKSGTFADAIRRIVWSDPSLDYTLQRPVGEQAKTDWLNTRMTDRDLFFRGAHDQIGIYYIYRGDCAPCRSASPIIAAFGRRYGVTIQAISTDGKPNPEFPDFKVDHGQLAAMNLNNPVTPSYVIYQSPTLNRDGSAAEVSVTVTDGKKLKLRPCLNATGCVTYLGAGVLTMDEMADRLFVTLATETGKDF